MVTIPAGAFLFLRHGQTESNAQELIIGSTDLPLNQTGHEQARQAADFLRGTALAQIISSPLLRARQTAEAAAEALQLPVTVLDGLAERNWGAWEGLPRTALRRDETPPGGESPQAFQARTFAAFAGIDLAVPTLIVAHSGTDRVLHDRLAPGPHHRMENAAIRLWEPLMHGTQWNCHEYFKPGR
ncbi:histidine phosphatase family protein [Paracoccus xiamenensis]|uniref:histidine phosphatase family protein n=1 Tax=Paracoccus xiamenensis TaxID=2714901 RepID=UPI001A999AFA|nr:histidine phosphatase family protein [Paracoccus xiamenensis]